MKTINFLENIQKTVAFRGEMDSFVGVLNKNKRRATFPDEADKVKVFLQGFEETKRNVVLLVVCSFHRSYNKMLIEL